MYCLKIATDQYEINKVGHLKRIHFDGSRLCPDGHKLQLGVKGQSTGLMREPMLHSL